MRLSTCSTIPAFSLAKLAALEHRTVIGLCSQGMDSLVDGEDEMMITETRQILVHRLAGLV